MEEIKLPTLQEAEAAVRKGERMMDGMRKKREEKLMGYDREMYNIVIGSVPSKSVTPVIK